MDDETDTSNDAGTGDEAVVEQPTVDYAAMLDAANAKIAELTTTVTMALADLQATKAANWDLTQLVGTGDSTAASDPDNSQNDDDDEYAADVDNPQSIDDLFGAAN